MWAYSKVSIPFSCIRGCVETKLSIQPKNPNCRYKFSAALKSVFSLVQDKNSQKFWKKFIKNS